MDKSKKLELCDKNVLEMFQMCLDKTKHKANQINLFHPSAQQKPAIIYMDGEAVAAHFDQINYMLGQLKAVHEHKEFISLKDGLLNYKNQPWTKNNASLYALYYFGIPSITFSSFRNYNGKLLSKIDYEFLVPTFWPPKN